MRFYFKVSARSSAACSGITPRLLSNAKASAHTFCPRVERGENRAVAVHASTAAEVQGNEKRWEESGKQGSVDSWQWTLNWDEITPQIVIGSCPRSTNDVVTLKRIAEADAILCLQSDGCFEALSIDYSAIRSQGAKMGIVMSRVAIWDFNHNDQALMIPEAVRKLALLISLGKRVYVHCTAGINRATLTVVSYLTFLKGWNLDDAVAEVKIKRPQAHPYLDCWHTMRARLTEGRTQEILHAASRRYEERKQSGCEGIGDSLSDWVAAESLVITELFERQLQADVSLMVSMSDLEIARVKDSVCISPAEFQNMQAEMGLLREKAEQDRAQARAALARAQQTADENRRLRETRPDAVALLESSERKAARLKAAEKEISALKGAIKQVAVAALRASSGADDALARRDSHSSNGTNGNGSHTNGTRNDSSCSPISNGIKSASKENGTSHTNSAVHKTAIKVGADWGKAKSSGVGTVNGSGSGTDLLW